MKKTSFRVDNLGTGATMSPSVLAAILIKRDNQVLTHCTQREVDEALGNAIEVTDHQNGNFTVKLRKRKGRVR